MSPLLLECLEISDVVISTWSCHNVLSGSTLPSMMSIWSDGDRPLCHQIKEFDFFSWILKCGGKLSDRTLWSPCIMLKKYFQYLQVRDISRISLCMTLKLSINMEAKSKWASWWETLFVLFDLLKEWNLWEWAPCQIWRLERTWLHCRRLRLTKQSDECWIDEWSGLRVSLSSRGPVVGSCGL